MIEFKVNKFDLFSTPVWEMPILGINSFPIIEYCHQVRKEKEGVIISNRGGWHSKELIDPIPHSLRELFFNIEQFSNEVCSPLIGVPNLMIGNFWININGPGNYNTPHDHQNSILSGTYYVSVPEENMGNLFIHRDDKAEYFLTSKVPKQNNLYNTSSYEIKSEESKLVIFPSWVKHSVGQNKSDKERISIAFNLVPKQ
jgi:uncharacterized protein (TIGR02466 family)